jgi:hypothetical protein
MKNLLMIVFVFCFGSRVLGQSTNFKWYSDSFYGTSCGEFTYRGQLIQRLTNTSECELAYPSYPAWYRDDFYGTSCGRYTPEGLFIVRSERKFCDARIKTYFDWYKDSFYGISCGEYLEETKLFIERKVDSNICRSKANGGNLKSNSISVVSQIPLNEIDQNLIPPSDSQILLSKDTPVPRNKGCGAPQSTEQPIQCYVCQAENSRNAMLYTQDSILRIGAIRMMENRQEIRLGLVDSDDLGTIRCLSSTQITITKFEELVQILELSGFKFKDAGPVRKTIGRANTLQQ